MPTPCIYEGEIAKIETKLDLHIENFKEFKENDFHEVKNSLKCIVEKMSKQRLPLWTTWLLTSCSALITGLIVIMVKR